jgi:hypothetical protein
MSLVEKIIAIYPFLTINDFLKDGTIVVMNLSDGKGDFIKEWNNESYPQPTQAQLDLIKE